MKSGTITTQAQRPPPAPVNYLIKKENLDEKEKASCYETSCIEATVAGNYAALETLIMTHEDALDGIVSKVELDAKKYPTGHAFVRDATQALPLEKRLAPDHPKILADNMLLRALNTLRGIDYVLAKKNLHKERESLKVLFKKLFTAVMSDDAIDGKKLKKLATGFNTELIKILIGAGLTEGLKSAHDYKKLLLHYRDITSALDPAKSLITILKDTRKVKDKTIKIIHTETAHPITKKTETQRNVQIKLMEDENPPAHTENFHAQQKKAFRIVNSCFAELLKKDDRRLSAQNRNTIGPTIKNGYMVHNQLEFKTTDATQKTTTKTVEFKSLRCGSPVYVGDHATDEQKKEFTREICQQLKMAAKEFANADNIHLTNLLTYSPIDHQASIISITKAVRAELGFNWSYVPLNRDGTCRALEISRIITNDAHCPSRFPEFLFNKAARLTKARDIILLASKKGKTINVTYCASGQDRTGSAQEAATQQWVMDQHAAAGIPISRDEIVILRTVGGHNALIATFATPGSLGMKQVSEADGYFTVAGDQKGLVNAYLYRVTAETNKDAAFDQEQILTLSPTSLRDDKLDDEKDAKDSAVTDQDIHWVDFRLADIVKDYQQAKKSKHVTDLNKLTAKINTDIKTNEDNVKKIKKMTSALFYVWNTKVADAYKDKENPNDEYIAYLNREKQNHHTFFRNIGLLLQDLGERFPKTTGSLSTSQTPTWLLSTRAHYRRDIKPVDYNDLIIAVEKLNIKELAPILNNKNLDYKAKYNEIISVLNKLWIDGVEQHKHNIMHASNTFQQHSDEIRAEVLADAKKLGVLHDVCLLLQTAQQKYPGITLYPIIRPPVPARVPAK